MKKGALIAALFLMTVLSVNLVLATAQLPAPAPGVAEKPLFNPQTGLIGYFSSNSALFTKTCQFIFGTSYADSGASFIVWIALWIIILVFAGDTLSTFTSLSTAAAWVIAACISIIAAASNAVTAISLWLLGMTAILGTASIAIVAGTAFLATAAIHLAIFPSLLKWGLTRQMAIMSARKMKSAKDLASTLEALGELRKPFVIEH